jgi:hypothetical protein
MRLPTRTVRAWVAGERQPANPLAVAQAVVDAARNASLDWSTDQHLRPEEICAELLKRAAMAQSFASVTVAMLAHGFGGIRALARAMAGQALLDLEPSVRRWRGLSEGPLRPVGDINSVTSRLGTFSCAEIRKRDPVSSL